MKSTLASSFLARLPHFAGRPFGLRLLRMGPLVAAPAALQHSPATTAAAHAAGVMPAKVSGRWDENYEKMVISQDLN